MNTIDTNTSLRYFGKAKNVNVRDMYCIRSLRWVVSIRHLTVNAYLSACEETGVYSCVSVCINEYINE